MTKIGVLKTDIQILEFAKARIYQLKKILEINTY